MSSGAVDVFAIVGMAPQIVTETLFALSREGLRVENLTLVTTSKSLVGELVTIGEDQTARLGARIIALGQRYPAALPRGSAYWNEAPLDDPRDPASVRTIGRVIDEALVQARGRAGSRTLVACLSGGRKSMTAWLTLSMTLRGRYEDRLVHVLVDKELEDPKRWPPQTTSEEDMIQLADVPFPKLRSIAPLGQSFVDVLISDVTRNVRDEAARTLDIELVWGGDKPGIYVRWQGEELPLTAAHPLAMLAFMAKAENYEVVSNHLTESQRVLFARLHALARERARGGPNQGGDNFGEAHDTFKKRLYREVSPTLWNLLEYRKVDDPRPYVFALVGVQRGNVKLRLTESGTPEEF